MAELTEKPSVSEGVTDVEEKRTMHRQAVHASGWFLVTMSFQALGMWILYCRTNRADSRSQASYTLTSAPLLSTS